MARRRFPRRSMSRIRRRRAPCDILPFNLCAQSLTVPPPPPDEDWSCANSLNLEFVILDGAALDTILKTVNSTAYFEGGQGASRGLSFLGSEFWLRASLNDTPSNFLNHNVEILEIRLGCALVVREWQRSQGLPVPSILPNLFSQDERELNGHVLYRWPLYLGPLPLLAGDEPDFVSQLVYVDTQGAGASIIKNTSNNTLEAVVGWPASSNMLHHRVKRRAFLDENHYLALCFSFAWGISGSEQTDVFGIGIEAQGIIKTRAK